MAISNAVNSRASVKIEHGKNSFYVSHLTLNDLAELRREHVVKLLETIDAYSELLLDTGEAQRNYGVISVILEMSDAIGHLIALAAKIPEQRQAVENLPIGVQIRALIEIAKLSLAVEALDGVGLQFADILTASKALRSEDIN